MNHRDKEARRYQDGARGRARWRPNKPVHELDAALDHGPGMTRLLLLPPVLGRWPLVCNSTWSNSKRKQSPTAGRYVSRELSSGMILSTLGRNNQADQQTQKKYCTSIESQLSHF